MAGIDANDHDQETSNDVEYLIEQQLIEEVRKHRMLYDPGSSKKFYHDAQAKEIKWLEIADRLNLDREWCKKKYNYLRDQFARRAKQLKNASKEEAERINEWKYFDMMKFILPYIKERERKKRGRTKPRRAPWLPRQSTIERPGKYTLVEVSEDETPSTKEEEEDEETGLRKASDKVVWSVRSISQPTMIPIKHPTNATIRPKSVATNRFRKFAPILPRPVATIPQPNSHQPTVTTDSQVIVVTSSQSMVETNHQPTVASMHQPTGSSIAQPCASISPPVASPSDIQDSPSRKAAKRQRESQHSVEDTTQDYGSPHKHRTVPIASDDHPVRNQSSGSPFTPNRPRSNENLGSTSACHHPRDEDELFMLSCVPTLGKLTAFRKMQLKCKIQQLLLEYTEKDDV